LSKESLFLFKYDKQINRGRTPCRTAS